MTVSVDDSQLREMIRELIRASVPALRSGHPTSPGPEDVQTVQITSNVELNAFVRTLIGILDDPARGPRLREGAITFSLGSSSDQGTSVAESQTATTMRVARGAVTEKVINTAAAQGNRIVLAGQAVLTPLARDRARKLGVEIVREP